MLYLTSTVGFVKSINNPIFSTPLEPLNEPSIPNSSIDIFALNDDLPAFILTPADDNA